MRTRTQATSRAAAVAAVAAVALGSTLVAAVPAQAAPRRAETPFAYQGSAYGTRVTAGDPNAGGVESGRTAWSALGCTTMAPIHNDTGSFGAEVDANDMIEVGAIDSVTSSYRMPARRIYGSRSVNKVAGLVIGPSDGPRLKFGALTTTAHAYNDRGRYRARASFDVVRVEQVGIPDQAGPVGDLLDAIDAGDNQLIEQVITQAGADGITIPGLGTIYPAGTARTPQGASGATANAYGIRVELENGSTAVIGRAWARIQKADPAGVFAGHAYGLEADAVGGALRLGRTPYRPMPCTGTGGNWRANTLAGLPGNAQLDADVLRAETFGRPLRDGRAVARARASVATLTLGGGALRIEGVVGQVNVFQDRRGRVVRRTTTGTRVGAIVANGEAHEIPAPGESLEIPGLARISGAVRQDLGRRGLRVHALRVELLDGSGLVLNVGTAKAKIVR